MKFTIEINIEARSLEEPNLSENIIREKLIDHLKDALYQYDEFYDGLMIDCSDDGDQSRLNYYNITDVQ